MTRRMQALLDGRFPYIVAEIDGAIAGYAYASLYRTRPAYRFSVEDSVYVAPDMQRRGVGSALLVQLIEACAALGFRQMIAVIGDSAQAPSIGVHKALRLQPMSAICRTSAASSAAGSTRAMMQLRSGRERRRRPRRKRDVRARSARRRTSNLH